MAIKEKRSSSARAAGYAALEKYLDRKQGEARRGWDKHSRGGDGLRDYWEGQYVALAGLRKRLNAVKTVPHSILPVPQGEERT